MHCASRCEIKVSWGTAGRARQATRTRRPHAFSACRMQSRGLHAGVAQWHGLCCSVTGPAGPAQRKGADHTRVLPVDQQRGRGLQQCSPQPRCWAEPMPYLAAVRWLGRKRRSGTPGRWQWGGPPTRAKRGWAREGVPNKHVCTGEEGAVLVRGWRRAGAAVRVVRGSDRFLLARMRIRTRERLTTTCTGARATLPAGCGCGDRSRGWMRCGGHTGPGEPSLLCEVGGLLGTRSR